MTVLNNVSPSNLQKPNLTTSAADAASKQQADYTVRRGDTLTSISKAHNTTVDEMMKANPQIKDRDLIFAGSVLKVPQQAPAATVAENAPAVAADACAAPKVVDAATQQSARVAARGRDGAIAEKLQKQLADTAPAATAPRTGVSRTPAPSTAPAAAQPAAAQPAAAQPAAAQPAAAQPAAAQPAASAGVASLGERGRAIAATADRLHNAKLIDAAELSELKNGAVGPQDVAIGARALDRLQASTPDAMKLVFDIPRMQNDVTTLQREGLEKDLGELRNARAGRPGRQQN
jgi:LysM repeat protein